MKITLTATLLNPPPNLQTPINLTNHTYFNLSPSSSTGILDHSVKLESDLYLPVDSTSIPTGEIYGKGGDGEYDVGMDLSSLTTFRSIITSQLKSKSNKLEQVEDALSKRDCSQGNPGIDHNYIVRGEINEFKKVGVLYSNDELSAVKSLTVKSNSPGVQVYSGNWINSESGKKEYKQWEGVCFEAQWFPDSVGEKGEKYEKWEGGCRVLKGEEEYRQVIEYEFEVN